VLSEFFVNVTHKIAAPLGGRPALKLNQGTVKEART